MDIPRDMLLDYFDIVIKLEKERYELNQVIESTKSMKQQPMRLPLYPRSISDGGGKLNSPPQRPDKPEKYARQQVKPSSSVFAVKGALLVLAVVIFMAFVYLSGHPDYNKTALIMIVIVATVLTFFVAQGIHQKMEEEKHKRDNDSKVISYKKRMEKYKKASAFYKTTLEAHNKEKQQIEEKNKAAEQVNRMLELAQGLLRNNVEELSKTLNYYYSESTIYNKYWNLIAMTSFYDYFKSGGCDSFGGAHGAYDTYEYELRLDVIISRLDQIASSLQRIERNQYRLFEEISQVNNNVKNLKKEFSSGIKWMSENYQEVASAISSYDGTVKSMNDTMNHGFSSLNSYIDRLTDINKDALNKLSKFKQSV